MSIEVEVILALIYLGVVGVVKDELFYWYNWNNPQQTNRSRKHWMRVVSLFWIITVPCYILYEALTNFFED